MQVSFIILFFYYSLNVSCLYNFYVSFYLLKIFELKNVFVFVYFIWTFTSVYMKQYEKSINYWS